MKNHESWRRFTGSIPALGVVILQSGCGNLPAIGEAETMELRTEYRASQVPEVDVEGNPHTRPGSLAMDAFEASSGCDWAVLFCAGIFVPIAAITGAAITAADTLPEGQARELNRLTRNVSAGLDLSRAFDAAMRAQAVRHGVNLRPKGADAKVRIVVTALWWEVTIGNHVYLRMKVEASAVLDGEAGKRRLGYNGDAASATEWLADNGKRIREELDTIMTEASEDIWPRLLDRD